jgi:hypothetical protein
MSAHRRLCSGIEAEWIALVPINQWQHNFLSRLVELNGSITSRMVHLIARRDIADGAAVIKCADRIDKCGTATAAAQRRGADLRAATHCLHPAAHSQSVATGLVVVAGNRPGRDN